MREKLLLITGTVFCCLFAAITPAPAQGTAFTYQGRLVDGGNPANGSYDLQFTVFDAATNGAQIAGPLINSATAVSNGLFTVTLDFGPGVFTGPDRWLDIAVRTNGGGSFSELSPRQPLTPTPYAITAGNANGVAAGVVTAASIAPGSIGAAQIGSNSITSGQLAPGAAAANLSGSGQAGVASGGLILSATENTALLNAGYVKIGSTTLSDNWTQLTNGVTPSGREVFNALWTGSEMLIWSGFGNLNGGHGGGTYLPDGARYNPAANSWTSISTNGAAPAGTAAQVWTGNEMIVTGGALVAGGWRYNPLSDTWRPITTNGAPSWIGNTAVWTGSAMIVWGGYYNFTYFRDGGIYDPVKDSWTAVNTNGAPSARAINIAVWTGSEMVVWGGQGSNGLVNDGGRYNPANNTWTTLSTIGAPSAREDETAVWTGSEMIIWGGNDNGTGLLTNDGGRYNPASDIWTAMSTNGAPSPRRGHTAVWTGSSMIIWGGYGFNPDFSPNFDNNGARYNPNSDSWTPVTTNGAPAARGDHGAVWTGSEMIVWGGDNNTGIILQSAFNDGGRYNPSSDSWIPVPGPDNVPAARQDHTAVWTGSEMIVWGGFGVSNYNDGARYNPAANSWTALPTNGAPSGRIGFTAVWTGTQMIVWGGQNNLQTLNDGARYSPANNSWTAVSSNGAPEAREFHTAVWTGSEMIVWGGNGTFGTDYLNDGGRYNPQSDSWTTVNYSGAPAGRQAFASVWTGSEMIVWGGVGNNATFNGNTYFNDGGRYNPASDTWLSVTTNGAPSGRTINTAVWTSTQMIVWGGSIVGNYYNDGALFNPAADSWTALTTAGGPSARAGNTAVWTGSEMIVWGGYDGFNFFNDGGQYNPSVDRWTPVTTSGAPPARSIHTAVWTGNQMLIWGGINSSNTFNDTWSYTPGKVMFLYQKP